MTKTEDQRGHIPLGYTAKEIENRYKPGTRVDVGDGIKSDTAQWKFNAKVAEKFDDHVRKSVPFYDECQRMILEISDYYITPKSIVYDLGLSTGNMLQKLMAAHKNKIIQFVGYDFSQDMIDYAQNKIGHWINLILKTADLNHEQNYSIDNASLVLLNYTLQFLEPKHRQSLISNIYRGLNDNGALIFIEKIIGNETRFNEMFIQLYYDMKLRNGLTLEEIKGKEDSLRGILKTYTLEQNMRLLRNAGFNNIDIFFKWYNFVGIIAVK